VIVLPEPVKKGEQVQLTVKFDNNDSIYKHNHSYSRVNREGWLPFVWFTDNIDFLDLTVAVDSKYQILGIDHKVSEKVEDGKRIARYKSDFPLTFPTIIFGDYRSDTSKVKATKADGTPIPVTVYADKVAMMTWSRKGVGDTTDVEDIIHDLKAQQESGMWDIRYDSLRPIADQAANAINLYREIFGVDYPFGKMDLVNDPMGSFYGQAPPSIVYLGFGVFWPQAKANLVTGADLSSFQNTVVAHELGHQWWGSAVVNANMGNYWFVESLAEYSSALYRENLAASQTKDPEKARKKGWNAYMNNVEEWRRTMMNNQNMFTSVQHSDSMFPGGDPGTRYAAIYNKGPYAFHMLRLLFGDEKFFRFLKEMAQELEGKEIVTRDIQRIAESSLCGTDDQGNPCSYDLEWFFDQWIRGVGIPEYSFNYTYRQAEDGTWVVQGNIKQRVVLGAEKREMPGQVFRGKIMITVLDKKKQEYNVPVVISDEDTPFAFKVPEEPFEVTLNKNGEMLAHDVLDNQDF
jgi:aminopeptidase N